MASIDYQAWLATPGGRVHRALFTAEDDQARDRLERERAMRFADDYEFTYGRRLSMAEARVAVVHGADGRVPAGRELAGETHQVCAQMRRHNPDMIWKWAPEQPSADTQWAGIVTGPAGGAQVVGSPALAGEMTEQLQRRISPLAGTVAPAS